MSRHSSSHPFPKSRHRRRVAVLCLLTGLTGLCPAWADDEAPTQITLTVTNDVTIDWVWGTQYMFTAVSAGNGAVVGAGHDWLDFSTATQVTAQADSYYHFAMWTGTVNSTSNPLPLTIDQPHVLVAHFAENLAAHGTPEWWLALHKQTNDWNAAELDDPDDDGMPTWGEWWSDTIPTNPASVLSVAALSSENGDVRLEWTGGEWAKQYVQYRQDLTASGELWISIQALTNLPTSITNTLLHTGSLHRVRFYRIQAER